MSVKKHFVQYCILCWKNLLLERTHYILVPAQTVTPIIMILIVFFIRQRIAIKESPDRYFMNFTISHLDIFYTGSQVYRNWTIAYCPSDDRVDAIMKSAMLRAKGFMFPFNESRFDNETHMVQTIMSNSTYKYFVFAGVVFDLKTTPDGGYNITYKLRFPAEQHWKSSDQSSWLTNQWYDNEPKISARSINFKGGSTRPGYLREGFLFLQKYIDDAIMDTIFRKDPRHNETLDPTHATAMNMFPYPAYTYDDFADVIRLYLPLFIIISFVINATFVAKEVTLEKEKKLKESMRLMGLKTWINYSAWFTKFFLFLLISIFIMTFLLHVSTTVGAIFNNTDPSVTFVFLLLYSISVIMFCFLMSSIFSKANVAAATTAIVYLLSYVPYYFMQINYHSLSFSAKMAFSLFNNLAMSFGCIQISRYEAMGIGMKWSNINNYELSQDGMTLQYVFIMLAVDSVLYGILTWYFDGIFPGEFGVPRPLYFPFTNQKIYSMIRRSRTRDQTVDVEPAIDYGQISEAFEKRDKSRRVGVRIRGITKVFDHALKPAVNNLNIDLYEGNITAFLGHNGAGKTTTMFMLTGFLKPSSGTAIIGGYDISKNMHKIRETLGFCPQHNILFDDLSVEQHLNFFALLKGCSSDEVAPEVNKMISILNLEDKRNIMSKALSGGMKRKLSIAIALIGGSKFVILDEPTSGMDPESRRQTWEMLQQERRGRTIILSTHFMDEADLLGDRIAIIAEGEIKCYGSPIFLKDKYGIGYHLTILKGPGCCTEIITNLIRSHVEEVKFEGELGAELTYLLPKTDSKVISRLFREIESEQATLGIDSFGASVTTIEEVFIRVAEETEESNSTKNENPNSFSQAMRYIPSQTTLGNHDIKTVYAFQSTPLQETHITAVAQRIKGLFIKRIINTWRSRGITIFQMVLPLIFTMLACIAIYTLPTKIDPPPLALNYPPVSTFLSDPRYVTPYLISPRASAAWTRCVKTVFPEALTKRINISMSFNTTFQVSDNMSDNYMKYYLMDRAKRSIYEYQTRYIGAIEIPENSNHIIGHFNDIAYHAIATILNKINNMRLCKTAQSTTSLRNLTFQINTINHPLPWRARRGSVGASTINIIMTVASIFSNSVAFGMGLAVGTFILFIVRERVSGAKHSQFLAGVDPACFWLTAVAWDTINYLASTLMVVFTVLAFGTEGYFENLGFVLLLILVYFWSMLPSIYCLSLVVQVPSTGYIIVTVVSIFTGTVANLAISILKYPSFKISRVAYKLEWIFYVFFPNFCLSKGLSDIYYNYQGNQICDSIDLEYNLTLVCSMSRIANEINPCCPDICGDICLSRTPNYADWFNPGTGRSLVFMGIQGFFFFVVLFLIDYNVFNSLKALFNSGQKLSSSLSSSPSSWLNRHVLISSESVASNKTETFYFPSNNASLNDPPESTPHWEVEDDDVFEEKNRTLSMLTKTVEEGGYALVIRDVSKFYGNFLAVNGLSVSISKGECFGLLGVNGAGKTTTFKMMTGECSSSRGEIYIEGVNVASHRGVAQSLIGYCPQFDALINQMTVEETLYMFARLRQINSNAIPGLVENLIDVLLLKKHVHKRAEHLSGGNKRKLSIAIALMGNPPIVFLDEPTTGMDPAARRKLWNTLTAIRESGKTIILTSHSMEECEALCTRLAIMVNGRFKCLGSTQHLKSKFGGGYTVVIKQKPNKRKELMEYYARLIMCFMQKVFPGNILKDRHEGLLHFQIDVPDLTWGKVFDVLEKAKDAFEMEDYSVGQTTLEQLFINFAKVQKDY